MRILLLFCVLLSFSFLSGQETNYQANTIDKVLTDNANAVVFLDDTAISLISKEKMLVSKKRVVAVLKSAGQGIINPYAYYDPMTKLKQLEAIVYDANGNQIKKIKKKDFKDVSAVDGGTLYSDSRIKYFEYVPTAYPYTISFSYSFETANTAFLPKWSPVDEYKVSTQKSSYTFSFPEGTEIRKKEKNFEGYPITNFSKGNTLHYQMDNMPATRYEMLSPPFFEIEPQLLLSLNSFHLEGLDGQGNDWETFGKWQYQSLLKERDALSETTIATVHNLVKGIEDPVEKTKKIYEYVQNNTRYISVQLGIGGWMPISAAEVDEVKYGDCKGLTNYTKALLKSQGIESFYSVVWAGSSKRNLEADFASMQGNHVILNVPNGEEDIWLECTSQQIPFGFLSDFTDDRDVLVVTSEGGTIKHTATYLNEDNKKRTAASYQLTSEGVLTADVAVVSEGIQYDNRSSIASLSDKRKDAYYKEYWSHMNGVKIKEMNFLNNKQEVQFVEHITLEVPNYGDQAGNDMLFKVNPFDINDFVPDRYRNRKQPFEIARGYLHENTYKVKLPASYTVSVLPAPIVVESKYGSYEVSIEKESDTRLVYKRKLLIKKGRYPKEEYNEYRNFRRKVAKGDNLKIVLTK